MPGRAGLGCHHRGHPVLCVPLSRGVAAGTEAPGDGDTPVQPRGGSRGRWPQGAEFGVGVMERRQGLMR